MTKVIPIGSPNMDQRTETVLHRYNFNDIPNDQAKAKVIHTAIELIRETYGISLFPQKVAEMMYEANPEIRFVKITEGDQVSRVIQMDDEPFALVLFGEIKKLPEGVLQETLERIYLNMTLRNSGAKRLRV